MAFSVVQFGSAFNDSGGFTTTFTFGSPTTQGNHILVFACSYYYDSLLVVSDNKTGSYQNDYYGNPGTGTMLIASKYMANAGDCGASHQMTLSSSGAQAGYLKFIVCEVSGLATATWFDAAGTGVAGTSSNVTTSNASDVVFTFAYNYGPTAYAGASPFTTIDEITTTYNGLGAYYQTETATGSYSATVSVAASKVNSVAYKQAGGGGGGGGTTVYKLPALGVG